MASLLVNVFVSGSFLSCCCLQIGDREQLERQRSQAEARRQQGLQEMNQHRGSLAVVQQNAREAKKSLSDPRYHQIADRYRKQLVEVCGVQGVWGGDFSWCVWICCSLRRSSV
jgi:outer membrane biogenesis lipoprotein LolB